MPSTALKDLQLEIELNAKLLAPIIEGLNDYAKLNITPAALNVVQAKLKFANERVKLMKTAADALTALDAHGFPDFDKQQVDAAIYADLLDQQTTISAALAKFATIEEADKATIVAGTPVDQP